MAKPLKVLAVKASYCRYIPLCVAVFTWSLAPSVDHSPRVLEALTEHADMVADHGDSHRLA